MSRKDKLDYLCLAGFGAAFVAYGYLRDGAEYYSVVFGSLLMFATWRIHAYFSKQIEENPEPLPRLACQDEIDAIVQREMQSALKVGGGTMPAEKPGQYPRRTE